MLFEPDRGESSERRAFLGAALAFFAALFPWAAIAAKAKKIALPFAKLKKLHKVGGWMVLKLKGREIILIRDAEKSVRAFDPTCTHEKCRVAYSPDTKRLDCGCHKSSYDLEGKVLGGPAPKPLRRYASVFSDDRIVLTLEE